MAMHRRFQDDASPWQSVLEFSQDDRFAFADLRVSADGDRAQIRNSDGTLTMLTGAGLAAGRQRDGEAVRLTAGTIEDMTRIAPDGTVIEALSGINVAVADGAAGVSRISEALSAPRAASGVLPSLGLGGPGHQAPLGVQAGNGGRKVSAAKVLALLAPVMIVVVGAMWLTTDPAENERSRLKWQFTRPSGIPHPPDNVLSSARVELGRRLFNEARLSADGSTSCATCHTSQTGFADGNVKSRGITRTPLDMHTPTLFNIAWANAFFWNGRAASLEEQALGPIEHPNEMGSTREAAVRLLRSLPEYVASFAAAFPEAPEITPATLAKALASFERTIVSPPTRFDRWIDGNPAALSPSEKAGFQIFIGKGGCANCHSGWAFTDHAFHDIGLPSEAPGRGRIIKRPALDQAFKTPTLRELAWTAPYMHDGSLATLEEVVAHYERGGLDRATRSPDMPRSLKLSARERGDLVAFLKSLSSDRPPQPASTVSASLPTLNMQSAVELPKVGQKNKRFSMERLRIRAGQSVAVINDDIQPHNIFIQDPRMSFDSGWQNPGERVNVAFPQPGDFDVFCGIHPNMRMRVEVEPSQ